MENYNFNEIILRILNFNKSGLNFFDKRKLFYDELLKKFNLTTNDLDFSKSSLDYLDENIFCNKSFEERKQLFELMKEHLLFYIFEVHSSKYLRKKAYIKFENSYCPILLDNKKRIDLGFLQFLNYIFKYLEIEYFIMFLPIYSQTFSKLKSYEYWYDKFDFENEPEIVLWEEK